MRYLYLVPVVLNLMVRGNISKTQIHDSKYQIYENASFEIVVIDAYDGAFGIVGIDAWCFL